MRCNRFRQGRPVFYCQISMELGIALRGACCRKVFTGKPALRFEFPSFAYATDGQALSNYHNITLSNYHIKYNSTSGSTAG